MSSSICSLIDLSRQVDPVEREPSLQDQKEEAIAHPREFTDLVKGIIALVQANSVYLRDPRWKKNLCLSLAQNRTCEMGDRCGFAHSIAVVYARQFAQNPVYKSRPCISLAAERCTYFDAGNKTWLRCCGLHDGDLKVHLAKGTVSLFEGMESPRSQPSEMPVAWNRALLSQNIDPLQVNGVPTDLDFQIELALSFPAVFIDQVNRTKDVIKLHRGIVEEKWKERLCPSVFSQKACERIYECPFAHALEVLIATCSTGDFRYKQIECAGQGCEQSGGDLKAFGACRDLHRGDLLIDWNNKTVRQFFPARPALVPFPILTPVWIRQRDIYGREVVIQVFMLIQQPPLQLQAPRVPSLLASMEEGDADSCDEGEEVAQSMARSVLATPPRHIAHQVAAFVLGDGEEGGNLSKNSEETPRI